MSGREQSAHGLRIVGEVALGFPPPRTSYARAAYSGAEPDTQQATLLIVRPDGTVAAFSGKVEYGQGIRTGLAIEVADELRLPLEAIEVVLGDTDTTPWDMGTFGSQSTARVGLQLRRAAATAREVLLELGADHLDLPASELQCRDGAVASRSNPDRSATYAELLTDQEIVRELQDDVELTAAGQFSIIGTSVPRNDAIERVTGKALYSQDVVVPGMLFARILRPPAYGANLVDADTTIADRMPGVAKVVRSEDMLAVLAETDQQAERAASVIQSSWSEPASQLTQIDMPDLLLRTGRDPYVTQEAGSLEDGFQQADEVIEQFYYLPYVSNAPMEPRAAVAQWEDGRLTVWAGTQRPFGLRAELAQQLEIEESDVRVIAPEIGGGFGSKSMYPVGLEAARLAQSAGRPVRVAYDRAEEMTWASVRPAALIRIKSGFTSDGHVVAWESDGYHAGNLPFLGRRGSDTPYAVANIRVTTYTSDSPLRTGSYRSLGGAANHFARESHMDEIAARVGLDPVEFRLRNLTHPRFRRVLEAAARAFGWSPAASPSGRGVGVALGLDVGSYVAACVQLDVRGSEVKVERVTAALDCGLTVNPEGAKNQVEGSVVMGMGTALYEAIDFRGGRLLNTGFTRYRVPRMNNAPQIDVELIGEPETPSTGAGEPGIVPVAPAIANAVFDVTERRIRELPIQRYLDGSSSSEAIPG
ncbi:MAG: xanthine dehydrogenase family protein molybdopterin-binding subunit [Chloroflexi bacterium]|nr:xanthine dehydrogenase family protein molybdopterin-binding subunit [Chloroflexota bacterium]